MSSKSAAVRECPDVTGRSSDEKLLETERGASLARSGNDEERVGEERAPSLSAMLRPPPLRRCVNVLRRVDVESGEVQRGHEALPRRVIRAAAQSMPMRGVDQFAHYRLVVNHS